VATAAALPVSGAANAEEAARARTRKAARMAGAARMVEGFFFRSGKGGFLFYLFERLKKKSKGMRG
jgi:hypothetical protein